MEIPKCPGTLLGMPLILAMTVDEIRISGQRLRSAAHGEDGTLMGPERQIIMRRLSGIVLCAALVTWIQGNASAAKAPKAPKSTAETLLEQQDAMIRECKPSEEQQKTLKEKFQLKRKALETWEQANTAKLTAAEDAAKTAQGNG